jgi:tRNA 2-selenouridine synthase
MSEWTDPELKNIFLTSIPLIDVRAPIEFNEGSLPHSVNLPIMNNEEREQVGTCYKLEGQAAAITLGHELVKGEIKEARILAWENYIDENPKAEVFCFRGGLRSQTSCQWLSKVGIDRRPISGGYKRMRRFLLSQIEDAPLSKIVRLGGYTGSGKTQVLTHMKNSIDLEHLASHRGSAFGEKGIQPSQVRFENELALELMRKRDEAGIILEDESSMIGKIRIPRRIFLAMAESAVIILKIDLEQRVNNIFNEYVKDSELTPLGDSLQRIAKSLGGQNFKDIYHEMVLAFKKEKTVGHHEAWITMLLTKYYDPLYEKGLKRQDAKIIFEGNEKQVLDFSKNAFVPSTRWN